MENELTAIIEKDGDWFVGWSFDVSGANGQGRTVEECRESIVAAMKLLLDDRAN